MQIAITGIGIISALGIGIEHNRKSLLEGKSALRKPKLLQTLHQEWYIGEVPYSNDELKQLLGLQQSTLTRNVLLGMMALREAIEDAQLHSDTLTNTPFVNGTTVGGMDITEQHYHDWLNGDIKDLSLILQHEADCTSRLLSEHFGLQGNTTISTACSSALNAIIYGANLLRTGVAKQVVVGGTEAMTKFHLNGFASLGILSSSICRPFQDDRDGINLGEGAAYLVLEDATSATQRGATIYGYLAGYGNHCDAYHQTASSPEGEGALDAMQSAISMADILPKNISYINAHGTATPNNDASELRAIQKLFGDKLPIVESTKPLTGHTTSASGSIETIFTLIRMKEKHYSYAICNAFGFGGNDSSIVLSEYPTTLPSMTDTNNICYSKQYTSDGDLDYKEVIPAMQARRMTPLTRQLLVVATHALQDAGVECPDGIVVGTRLGGMIPTSQLLTHLIESGEKDFSPALFMNSTHNAAAGTLARFLHCKGYNSTIVSSQDSFVEAMKDAKLQLQTKIHRCMLVCSIEEIDTTWQSFVSNVGIKIDNKVQAQVIWQD